MKTPHCFGGVWTQDKLNRLSKYLTAYINIFKTNERAKFFSTYYVDAFAGTGHRASNIQITEPILFSDSEALEFQQGSAAIALDMEPGFDHYIFIDTKQDYIKELEALKEKYRKRDIAIVREDSNKFLPRWCAEMDWNRNRAVAFLDPYGAQVEWNTIECIAATQAIDLWLLFPLGQAVNRMLTRKEPDPSWCSRLDCLFGTEEWKGQFYRPSKQRSLFHEEPSIEKQADFNSIGNFFVKRLESVFSAVSNRPLALCNSKNIPIFLLCFASANPKGAKTAIKIANHILRN
jgi:three-Cys-motif partner protein